MRDFELARVPLRDEVRALDGVVDSEDELDEEDEGVPVVAADGVPLREGDAVAVCDGGTDCVRDGDAVLAAVPVEDGVVVRDAAMKLPERRRTHES